LKKSVAVENFQWSLSKTAKIFLAVLCISGVASSISTIFINVYLYKLSGDIYEVALFNFVSYVVWIPSFLFAGWFSKKSDRKMGIVIGIFFQILFYLLILLLGESSSEWTVLLGATFGIGSGFFWLSVNVLSVDFTNQSNRKWFNGVNGMSAAFSQMTGPLAAGWIVEWFNKFSGYYVIFSLSLCLFLLSIGLTSFLPGQKGDSSFQWSSLISTYRSTEWRRLSYVFSTLAFRDGVLSFMIWIWIFLVTGSEGLLGNYAFLMTVLSVVTFYIVGRFGRETRNWRSVVLASFLFSLAISLLVFDVNYITLLIYGVAAGVCIPVFEVPFNTLSLNSISNFDQNGKLRVEMVVSREMALSFGRIPSVGGFMLVLGPGKNDGLLAGFMAFVILVGLSSIYFLKRYLLVLETR
jgi:YQGE family putative transporter